MKESSENNKITKLAEMISTSNRIVAFTGAGVSTESDIPDFRSSKGVYEKIQKEYHEPGEVLLSHSFFKAHPEIFFDYLRKYLIFPNALPNKAHKSLAKLEELGKLSCVITQNIDGLHTKAGSKNVLELHGSLNRNYCVKCKKSYPLKTVLESNTIPRCSECGGIIRPDIVLYEEPLNGEITNAAIEEIEKADMLLIMGTSLAVYPAAGFIKFFGGENLAIINRDKTPLDYKAKLVINAKAGETLDLTLKSININI